MSLRHLVTQPETLPKTTVNDLRVELHNRTAPPIRVWLISISSHAEFLLQLRKPKIFQTFIMESTSL